MTELYQISAREVVGKLRNKEVSPAELIDAAEARTAAVEGDINALPTLCFDRAREAAKKIPKLDDTAPGWLGGLPIAVKDMSDVAGVRTTYGSPIYANHVPTTTDLTVEILEEHGALVVAKANTPEFAAGANTFNEVFGATINPWGAGLCAGGSSGGSAAALAAGEVWLATGSDLGGSLRTPASFCGVVGLRPSPGRVARSAATPFDTLSVAGPMARDVRDAALFLDAMVGAHRTDPLALEAPHRSFQSAANAPVAPKRIAFSPDLGQLPVEADVRDICTAAVTQFGDLETVVAEDCPDFSGAYESFQTLRALSFVSRAGDLLKDHRDKLKPEIIWNAEKGLELTPQDVARANDLRGALNASMGALFENHDFFVCPAAPVRPFDVNIRYVEEIEGTKLQSYVDWIAITFMITLTGCPAISIPCGFSEDGLPIGLQIVGPPRGEAKLLSAASAIEEMFGHSRKVPIDPRT